MAVISGVNQESVADFVGGSADQSVEVLAHLFYTVALI